MQDIQARAAISGDAFRASPYFADAEPHMERQWRHFIWPRIERLDRSVVLDLAAGHGRNTAHLLPVSGRVIAADINQECLDAIEARFPAEPKLETAKLSGASFDGVADGAVSLLYCWDAMVHFEPHVVESYVADAARILRPGGYGLIHHSNWTGGWGADFKTQPHWRNYMSRDIFAWLVRRSGLELVDQAVIHWDESIAPGPLKRVMSRGLFRDLDCITIFRKA